jgi:hypothetical protein
MAGAANCGGGHESEGAGRRRLATALGISEHTARRLLDAARNGHPRGLSA